MILIELLPVAWKGDRLIPVDEAYGYAIVIDSDHPWRVVDPQNEKTGQEAGFGYASCPKRKIF